MARDRLTALQVKRAHEKGEPVLLPDGAGLYLRKQSASGTAWTLRYRFGRQWRLCGNEVGRLRVASPSNELPALACYLAAAATQRAESNQRLL